LWQLLGNRRETYKGQTGWKRGGSGALGKIYCRIAGTKWKIWGRRSRVQTVNQIAKKSSRLKGCFRKRKKKRPGVPILYPRVPREEKKGTSGVMEGKGVGGTPSNSGV